MTTLQTGKGKVKQICEILRKETLQPAEHQALQIVEEANQKAKQIIDEAKKEAEHLVEEARSKVAKEKNVFEASLSQAALQSLEIIRQEIEKKVFNENLQQLVESSTKDPEAIAKLIESITQAVQKEGLSANIEAVVSKNISKESVNACLGEAFLKNLLNESVSLGRFSGGAQIKIIDKRVTIDISDKALNELVGNFLRKDFRELLFNKK